MWKNIHRSEETQYAREQLQRPQIRVLRVQEKCAIEKRPEDTYEENAPRQATISMSLLFQRISTRFWMAPTPTNARRQQAVQVQHL